ncbi:hypothetical protein JWG39_02780 [Desulforhopalus vacuolatus]|uniref:hypothetical protein n=1 Tax=Desulforhopalus vacuolatus TaxID=40414 RepID=UPI0019642CB2|nr:hypothetical protein [Desulforhopalus vacuolatus]MBM9518743.1 hypothetical protein [Desulforhopalus vacuolatus]
MSDNTNNNENGDIDWNQFLPQTQQAPQEPASPSIDPDMPTAARVTVPTAPTELDTNIPDKPKMMQYLTNYKAAKISQNEYVTQLKHYAKAHTEIMKDQLQKTVQANAALSESSLRGVHEKIRAWAQEITAVTDLSMQNTISKSIEKASEIANESVSTIAKMKNPHPLIQQKAIDCILDTMTKTVDNIKAGGANFEKGKLQWRK